MVSDGCRAGTESSGEVGRVGRGHRDVTGGMHCGVVDSCPVQGPPAVAQVLGEEEPLCPGVAVPKRVDTGQFTPVIGGGRDGFVKVCQRRAVLIDCAEDAMQLTRQILRDAVNQPHGAGVLTCRSQLPRPRVYVLQYEPVDSLEVGK